MRVELKLILVWIGLVTLISAMSDTFGQNPQHEFGSIRGPRASHIVPFWKLEGDAAATEDVIRVVPDRQSKKGGIWNTQPNSFSSWEVTYRLRVHGVSVLGADGLAFWYVKSPGTGGDFFGYTDEFTGLGVILDTYDNDNSGLHPLLLSVVNDGTKKFRHEHPHDGEGVHLKSDMEVGNCQFQIRNRDHPSLITIRYEKNQLSIFVAINEGDTPKECVSNIPVTLSTGYYFGFTAATGQLADNHDVYGVAVRNLDEDANEVDSIRSFGHFDKFSVSEQLARINYEVRQLGGSGANLNEEDVPIVKLGTDVWEQLHRIEDIGTEVTGNGKALQVLKEKIEELESSIGSAGSGAGNGGSGGGGSRKEVEAMKSEVEGMHSTLRSVMNTVGGLETAMRELREGMDRRGRDRGGVGEIFPNVYRQGGAGKDGFADTIISTLLTIVFWVVVVVVVLILGVGIFVIWKRKRDKQRKYF
eukprot:TRINITY_DN2332_c0_g1_i1.p1 TRINITY_DN2332_c0_g1~~TRINITY_DN2332_c0_g1_i1.p1  ORF type:complete len:472 (+),score=157.18 TRINITY_DN2332_c0_g1_i1:132-1547(+)